MGVRLFEKFGCRYREAWRGNQIQLWQYYRTARKIHQKYTIDTIIANEETGLQWSWNRDKLVADWCDLIKLILLSIIPTESSGN